MNQALVESLNTQLLRRKRALTQAISEVGGAADLVRLLGDVDRALERLGGDDYGLCAVCGGAMDDEEMLENPSREYCLCKLTPVQQSALQRDLDLAWRVQSSLLPDQDLTFEGWQTHFRYRPAGPVSGDYCDVIPHPSQGGWLYFLIGDVSGKGVAASYLMAHISALVRRTLDEPISVSELMATVNRHLLERNKEYQFITLLCGRANREGRVEICNAGHCLPIIVAAAATRQLASNAMPLGIAAGTVYPTSTTELNHGDSLVLYSDGISEARDFDDRQYGAAAVAKIAHTGYRESPARMAAMVLSDVREFQKGQQPSDDVTLMVVRRLAA